MIFRRSYRVGLNGLLFFALCFLARGLGAESHPSLEPYPRTPSKKGLQVERVDDAIALGVRHAALNLDLAGLIDLDGGSNSIAFEREGRTFHFRRDYVEANDRRVKSLSDAGMVVTLILLNYRNSSEAINQITLHPRYDPACPNHLSAFNAETPEGRAHFQSCLEFIAGRNARADRQFGRVWNYIVGNEVNSHWFWCNMGRVTMEQFADDHLRAVRLCATAVKKYSAHARVFVSLEHHWNIHYPGGDARQTFPARNFLEYFARQARAGGDFDWNIAFHPYPENLFNPRTWLDKSATTNRDTPRITFKNLELLPAFLQAAPFLFAGHPRHIILSEQGFHMADTSDGELIQAAAYGYAYYKADHLPGIDAFIYHRHVDNAHEGGLNLGLWRRETAAGDNLPSRKKKIYEVFQHADQPDWEPYFAFALPVIGIARWEEILPATVK